MLLRLIAGLVIFHGVHLVPTMTGLRERLRGNLGSGAYQGLFGLVSAIGLYLIVTGYAATRTLGSANPQLFVPPTWTRHIVMLLMLIAFILLVAAYVPSRIRNAVKHPMLAAVKTWAFAHLLVRGDLASVLLFGSFLAYGVYDRISVKKRAAMGPLGAATGKPINDVFVLAGGLALYGLFVVWAHGALIGVPLLPMRVAP